jgi:hypothetical protein
MIDYKGTPGTLDQAIENAITMAAIAVNEHSSVSGANMLRACIKDFLAQKFGAAFFKAESDEELLRLKQLWDNVAK